MEGTKLKASNGSIQEFWVRERPDGRGSLKEVVMKLDPDLGE